jgi:hypothetical protein
LKKRTKKGQGACSSDVVCKAPKKNYQPQFSALSNFPGLGLFFSIMMYFRVSPLLGSDLRLSV